MAPITARVQDLGLKVAAQKTETLWFHGLSFTRRPPITWLAVQSERIRVNDDLKYLDVTLGKRLRFDAHFAFTYHLKLKASPLLWRVFYPTARSSVCILESLIPWSFTVRLYGIVTFQITETVPYVQDTKTDGNRGFEDIAQSHMRKQ